MPNPDGTYTRKEHAAAIMGLYAKNLKAGMDEESAMTKAGEEWRGHLTALGEAKIAFLKERLGIKG